MPQGANTVKSRGSDKKSRPPAHQNTYAFKHNPKSKLTEKILNSPIQHCCRRCTDKLEWRKQYRKYKPLTQLGKCNFCNKKNIKSAYHTICEPCTTSSKAKKHLIEIKQKENDDIVLVKRAVDEEMELQIPESAAASTNVPTLLAMDTIHRVCAMCVKEVALPDEEQAPETVDEILAREARRVSLRERKAMERKLERENVDEKKIAKAERRRLRREEEEAIGNGNRGGENEEDEDTDGNDDEIPEFDSNDEEDPFLQAVGGRDKLLIGDAYQQMLLSRERAEQLEWKLRYDWEVILTSLVDIIWYPNAQ